MAMIGDVVPGKVRTQPEPKNRLWKPHPDALVLGQFDVAGGFPLEHNVVLSARPLQQLRRHAFSR